MAPRYVSTDDLSTASKNPAVLVRRAVRILRLRSLPAQARLDLARLAALRIVTRRPAFRVRLPSGPVFLDRRTLRIDLAQLVDVFEREPYATDYDGAVVLDIGAHKGYFAGYALSRGAARVRSFEPEEGNFAALAHAVSCANGADWTAERAAVGGSDGVVELAVSASSWAHSIVPRSHAERDQLGSQHVELVAAGRILPGDRPAAGRLIVKVNAEGAECDIVLDTPPERWSVVDEVFVETHDFTGCPPEDLVAHLRLAGLVLRRGLSPGPGYHDLRFVRAEPA